MRSLYLVIILGLLMTWPSSAQSVLDTPASQGQASEPSGTPDHHLVVGSFGARVVRQGTANSAMNGLVKLIGGQGTQNTPVIPTLNIVGVRYWFSKQFGLDAGIAFLIHDPVKGDTQYGFGFAGGVPIVFSTYKHLTLYLEPKVDFAIFHVRTNNNPWTFGLGGDVGCEVTFGWLGIPRLSTTFAIGLGMRVINDGDSNDFSFGTRDFMESLEGNFGIIYYF